jgi:hypothetical protein
MQKEGGHDGVVIGTFMLFSSLLLSFSCCGFLATNSSVYYTSNLQVITYFSMSRGDKKKTKE